MPNKQPISLQLCNCINFGISNLQAQEKDPLGKLSKINSGAEIAGTRKLESRNLNQRWFLRGTINIKQAENIITLIRDMANVRFTRIFFTYFKIFFQWDFFFFAGKI